MSKLARRIITLGLLAVGVMLIASCGGDDNGGGAGTSASTSASTTPDSAGLAAANKLVEEGWKGTHREPPSTGPAAQKNKNVWIVSCIQAAGSGCAENIIGIDQAVKAMNSDADAGWKTRLIDGKGDPLVWNQAIRQAIAAKVDGVIMVATDCPFIKSSLKAATDAGVPVVGVYAHDCDDPLFKGEKLFAAIVNYGTPKTGDYFEEQGRLRAAYSIAKTNGKAKVIMTPDRQYTISTYQAKGYKEYMKENCPDCEIVAETQTPFNEVVEGKASQKLTTLLNQHPDANVVVSAYDSQSQALAQAIRGANRPNLLLVGEAGYPKNLELIREGVQAVAVSNPVRTIFGWAAVDTMNRVLAGETEIPDQGTGFTIVDKEHNLPETGVEIPVNVDYKAGFLKVWSGGQ